MSENQHTVYDHVDVTIPGDHPETAEVTLTIRGPICKVQDYGTIIIGMARRYAEGAPGKPCGCKDDK